MIQYIHMVRRGVVANGEGGAVDYSVDDVWRLAVINRMKLLGINRKQLAKLCGVSPAAITQLLRMERDIPKGSTQKPVRQSHLKPLVHKHLGLVSVASTPAVPLEHITDGEKLMLLWPHLTDRQREMLLDMATEFRKNR